MGGRGIVVRLIISLICLGIIIFGLANLIKAESIDDYDADDYDPWRVAYTATFSQEELLPLYEDDDLKSTTLGGYYAGVKVLFREDEISSGGSNGVLVPVCVGELGEISSMMGFMERSKLIEWDDEDPESDRPVPYTPILFVQNPSELSWLNLRELPTLSSRVLDQYKNGAPITVLGVVGEWLHVMSIESGLIGFMSPQYLSPIGDAHVLTSDEFTFGKDAIPITLQLLDTGSYATDIPSANPRYDSENAIKLGIVQVLDTRHDVIQTITVQSMGRLDQDANFVLEDMNFDGYPDFRVMVAYKNNRSYYQYWLFDPNAVPEDEVNPWRFVREKSYEVFENEPVFDATFGRIYTKSHINHNDYQTYEDCVYDLVNAKPRLIEKLVTIVKDDGARSYEQYELQGDEIILMHEWTENKAQ